MISKVERAAHSLDLLEIKTGIVEICVHSSSYNLAFSVASNSFENSTIETAEEAKKKRRNKHFTKRMATNTAFYLFYIYI